MELKPIHFDISVVDAGGSRTSLVNQLARYVLPDSAITACVNLDDILAEQQRRIGKQLDPSKLPDKYKKLNGIYKVWNSEGIVQMLYLSRRRNETFP